MRQFPDVLGMELEKAAALLEKKGLSVTVAETKPPRGKVVTGQSRVIKQEFQEAADRGICLTVCSVPDAYDDV